MSSPDHIAIIGAGFSGTATALNLISLAGKAGRAVTVTLIDRAAAFGKGLAYATEDDNLVLNVPSGNMSALANQPDDFLDYCLELDSALNSGSFMFRRVYGEYLHARLQQAKAGQMLNELDDRVVALQHDGKFTLSLASGQQLQADQVVLAFGHFAPRPLSELFGAPDMPVCVNNPWDICAIDRLPHEQDVLIAGTGHTAIDTLFRLVSAPSDRKIYLVSRHGHAPNGHRKAGEFVKLAELSAQIESAIQNLLSHTPTIRAVFAAIRSLVGQHDRAGGNWRDIINSLRPLTPVIWQALPAMERARFLRHVVFHWDVLRHRLAPVALRRLESLLASGKVEIIAGRIVNISADMQVNIKLRGSSNTRQIQVGSVINCTGPNYDIRRVNNPLVQQLAAQGQLQQDAMKIGFEIDEQYRCSAVPQLYYIGPMLKARYWEAIAVPELRVHAHKLATILLAGAS